MRHRSLSAGSYTTKADLQRVAEKHHEPKTQSRQSIVTRLQPPKQFGLQENLKCAWCDHVRSILNLCC